MPELGSTPQLVPVAEAPAVAPAPEPPETPALPAEPESGALPTCRQDDSRMASKLEITSRIAGDTRHGREGGPSYRNAGGGRRTLEDSRKGAEGGEPGSGRATLGPPCGLTLGHGF